MRFALGQRVTWTHETGKDRDGDYTTWVSDPLAEPRSGIVVGFRSLSDHRLERVTEVTDGFGMATASWTEARTVPHTARRAWLVVRGLRNKPVLVLDEHVSEA